MFYVDIYTIKKNNVEKGTRMNTFIQLIQSKYEELSPRQRQLSDYIVENFKEAAFMNSVSLAKKLNVSNPTVIRYATALGFSSYPDFQQSLQTAVQNQLSSLERIDLIEPRDQITVAKSVFDTELNNINNNVQKLDQDNINSAVKLLADSDITFIVGNQVSATLAEYSSHTLRKIRDHVIKLSNINLNTEKQIKNKKCSALVFMLPRYPTKTLDQMEWLHQRNIPTVVVTGGELFPFSKYADVIIPINIKYLSYVDPLSSVLCVINTLFIELANLEKEKTNKNLDIFENFASENEIYYK